MSAPPPAPLIQPVLPPVIALATTEESPIVSSSLETKSPPWEVRFGEIAREPEWLQSQEELEELADGIPGEQLRAALDELAGDPSSAGVIVARRLVQRWAAEAPEAAAKWAASLPNNAFGEAMCRQAADLWAQADLAAAVAWAMDLSAGGNKTAAIDSLALEAATQKDTLAAMNLVANLPAGTDRNNLLNYVVQQWAATDMDAAISWIKDIDDASSRGRILRNVAVNLGAQNPSAAAQLITGSMDAGPARDEGLAQVVRFWAASAPEQAAEWVQGLSDETLRDTDLQIVTDVWRKDQAKESDVQGTAAQQL